MSASDLDVYRSCYCESCHQLRKNFGIISTGAVNYDMTFNGMILNALSKDGLEEQNVNRGIICVLGKCSADNDILKKMAGYTLLLTKWELEDDMTDRPGIRSGLASIALGRAIRKASKLYPEYDEFVGKGFDKLREMELNENTDPVKIGRTFASSLVPAMRDIAGDGWNDHLDRLFTSLGTMIYVMDAADDLEEDYMNDSFNPFLAGCDDFVNANDFIQKNVYRITEMMNSVMKDIQSSYLGIRDSMRFHHGVTDNIVYYGIPDSAKRIIACECTSKPSIRNAVSSRILRRKE